MKLLVDKTDLVKVEVFCWETEEGGIEASHLKTDIPQSGIDQVEKVEFYFRKPSYSDSNSIIRSSDIKSTGEDVKLDVPAFQNQILRTLLVDWSIKEEDKKIAVNNATIGNLVPSVARAAVSGVLDKIKM